MLNRIQSRVLRTVTDRAKLGSASALAEVERIREEMESIEEERLLHVIRRGRKTCWEGEDQAEPLVTVRIPTYNRSEILLDRTLPSIIRQTYERLEILIVGDNCDERVARALNGMGTSDSRVRFVNLPARGIYPEDPAHRWMVAGSAPLNAGLMLAKGSWIAPCDDDDEFTADHVESLLSKLRSAELEMVHSKAKMEMRPDDWEVVGQEPLQHAQVTHGSVMYSANLRFMLYSNTCWRISEPADWNLWKRMRNIGARIGFLDQVTYIHYLEARHRHYMNEDGTS